MSSNTTNTPAERRELARSEGIFWGCCNCGRSGGNPDRATNCYDCSHTRCATCPQEHHHFMPLLQDSRNKDEGPHQMEGNLSREGSNQASSSIPTTKPLATALYKSSETSGEFFANDLEFERLPSPGCWENRSATSFNGSVSSADNIFDLRTNSSSTESEEDETESRERRLLRVLDSRFLEVFQSNLGIAAVTLPKIHQTLLETEYPAENDSALTNATATDWNHEKLSPVKSQSISNLAAKELSKPSGEIGKHIDTEPRRAGKRHQKEPAVSFACHFHKRDPIKYSHTNSTGNKYRKCGHIRIPELRRIKDHFKSVHLTWQCGRCHEVLHEEVDRVAHLERQNCVPSDEYCSGEGINIAQWTQIEAILRRKATHPTVKWFETWDVLFPGVPRPSHPYNEEFPDQSLTPTYKLLDIPSCIEQFRKLIEIDQGYGGLAASDVILARYTSILEQVLMEATEKYVSTAPSSTPASEPNPAQDSYPVVSGNKFEVEALNTLVSPQQKPPDSSHDADPTESLEPTSGEQFLSMAGSSANWLPTEVLTSMHQPAADFSFESSDMMFNTFYTNMNDSPNSQTSPSAKDSTPSMAMIAGSDTELESEFEGDDMDEDEDETYNRYILQHLDCRFFEVFASLPGVASNILPKLHSATFYAPVDANIRLVPAGSSGNGAEGEQGHNNTSIIPKKSTNAKGDSGKQSGGKRKRDNDEGDKEDDDKQKRPKNPRVARERRMMEMTLMYACHFYKCDPNYFSHRNGETRNYKNCAHPSIPVKRLRQIKDHFKAAHVTWQCARCREFFHDEAERVPHLERKDCVQNNSIPLKEGIHLAQWAEIEKLLREPGHEVERWRNVWHVLFPGRDPPCPYQETQVPMGTANTDPVINMPEYNADSLIADYIGRFQRRVERDRKDDLIRQDDLVPERYILFLRQILHEFGRELITNLQEPASGIRSITAEMMHSPFRNSPREAAIQEQPTSRDGLPVHNSDFLGSQSYAQHLQPHDSPGEDIWTMESLQTLTATTSLTETHQPGEDWISSWAWSLDNLAGTNENIPSLSEHIYEADDVGVQSWEQFYYQ